jgi:hypothetical protein
MKLSIELKTKDNKKPEAGGKVITHKRLDIDYQTSFFFIFDRPFLKQFNGIFVRMNTN